jgi:predicted SAM-dependent methyltransferase
VGADSPIKYCKVNHSVGVNGFLPFMQVGKEKKIHNDYVLSDIRYANFRPASIDMVLLIEVLEHLFQKDSKLLLEKGKTWTKRKVAIASPNGLFHTT